MVEVQAGYRTFKILVVVHPAVLPVQVLDLIQTFEQVKVGSASERITEISIHLKGISRHV